MDAVRDPERGPFTAREKLGFRCAERLHRSPYEIDDEFYALLKNSYNDSEIIELVATATAWEFFTRFVDTLRIPTTPLVALAEKEGGRHRAGGSVSQKARRKRQK